MNQRFGNSKSHTLQKAKQQRIGTQRLLFSFKKQKLHEVTDDVVFLIGTTGR